jgi:hypothetical protein
MSITTRDVHMHLYQQAEMSQTCITVKQQATVTFPYKRLEPTKKYKSPTHKSIQGKYKN